MAKCHLKNVPVKGLCVRCLGPLFRPPPLYDPILSPLHTVYVYRNTRLLIHTGKGGGELIREKVRGATVHKAGSKIVKIPTWMTVSPKKIQSINSNKHLPQSPFTDKTVSMTLCFGVYVAN